MEGSGDLGEGNFTGDEPLLTGDVTTEIVSKVADILTTDATPIPYTPSHLRIGFLAIKCVLALLLFTITVAIRRRDFLKYFVFILLVPILLECGFDIFTEIRASMDFTGRVPQHYDYYRGNIHDFREPLYKLQSRSISIFGEVLTYYTTYNLFINTWWISLIEYCLSIWLFWTSLISSIAAFQFAHKAISRPDEICYTHFFRSFLCLQLLVALPITAIDVVIAAVSLPHLLVAIVTVILRLIACIAALFLIIQAFISLFVFCKRRDEYVKTSPYAQVRHSKGRLFWFILFEVVLQLFAVPYLLWAGISLAEDFSSLFDIPLDIPRHLALEGFAVHFSCFLLRSLVIIIFSIVLLPPYRKKFCRACCSCCSRN